MTSFETISVDDYKKLVDNEKQIFNLTENFSTPEILNKYRHSDKNVDKKIKEKEKYENLDKIINKSIDKIKTKPKMILQLTIITMMTMMMIIVLVF